MHTRTDADVNYLAHMSITDYVQLYKNCTIIEKTTNYCIPCSQKNTA